MSEMIHATCVARHGRAALLRGPSGSGKSDLAFRFLETYPDGWLIADDQVMLAPDGEALRASPPKSLRGLLEVRGLGLVRRATPAALDAIAVSLIVDLSGSQTVGHIADPAFAALCGIELPVIPLMPFEVSAPAKLALALETIGRGHFPGDDGLL